MMPCKYIYLRLIFAFHECLLCPTCTAFVENFSLLTMEPKRDASKETTDSSIGEEIENTSVDFSVYVDTQLFIERGQH